MSLRGNSRRIRPPRRALAAGPTPTNGECRVSIVELPLLTGAFGRASHPSARVCRMAQVRRQRTSMRSQAGGRLQPKRMTRLIWIMPAVANRWHVFAAALSSWLIPEQRQRTCAGSPSRGEPPPWRRSAIVRTADRGPAMIGGTSVRCCGLCLSIIAGGDQKQRSGGGDVRLRA